jgi:hypothetical protein
VEYAVKLGHWRTNESPAIRVEVLIANVLNEDILTNITEHGEHAVLRCRDSTRWGKRVKKHLHNCGHRVMDSVGGKLDVHGLQAVELTIVRRAGMAHWIL